MAYVNSTRSDVLGLQGRFGLVLKSVRAAVERRRVYQQTLFELNGLSDRDLADLGIARASIADIAREAAYTN